MPETGKSKNPFPCTACQSVPGDSLLPEAYLSLGRTGGCRRRGHESLPTLLGQMEVFSIHPRNMLPCLFHFRAVGLTYSGLTYICVQLVQLITRGSSTSWALVIRGSFPPQGCRPLKLQLPFQRFHPALASFFQAYFATVRILTGL